jgi:RNA polymerase sigma-70 factor (ECF subfamily)
VLQAIAFVAMRTAANSLSDSDCALRVAQGDQEAFRQLLRRHDRMLYRTARSILKDDAQAEDALQEAYLRVFRAIADFRGEAKLSAWLFRIVVNEALQRLRERARAARAFPIAHQAEDVDAIEAQSECAPEEPERAVQRARTRDLLEAKAGFVRMTGELRPHRAAKIGGCRG